MDELLNGYKRVMTSLKREGEPDYVPVWELITNELVITKLFGKISLFDFVEKMDLDGITVVEDRNIC